MQHVAERFGGIRPVNPRNAIISVFNVISRHVPRGQCEKVRGALPAEVQILWKLDQAAQEDIQQRAARGREAQNAQDARNYQSRPKGQRRAE